jgi:type IV secretory pathway VirD2 relaxase
MSIITRLKDTVGDKFNTVMTTSPSIKSQIGDFKFHIDGSKISSNYFTMKISYKGSSYELT